MIIGVDYYPEHWDKPMWTADADLMKKTGVKLVRMAEFAWCRLEPEDGRFDFGWLDEITCILAERGIDIVLGTPTRRRQCKDKIHRWRSFCGKAVV